MNFSSFTEPMPESERNLTNRTRSSNMPWRGQFSPQFVEAILRTYCPHRCVVLDPFCGSGTVLAESVMMGCDVIGVELNPAAFMMSRVYSLARLPVSARKVIIAGVRKMIGAWSDNVPFPSVPSSLETMTPDERTLAEAAIVLSDAKDGIVSRPDVLDSMMTVERSVLSVPEGMVRVLHADSRRVNLPDDSVDFVLTSPPYINVFNYHQNFRGSVEAIGWNVLPIARSEIGSNRSNRGNRFLTVVQYSIDMMVFLSELGRLCSPNARIVLVVGRESRVLGVSFPNSLIVQRLSTESGLFRHVLTQERSFLNRFGKVIREDMIHLVPSGSSGKTGEALARMVAVDVLDAAKKGMSPDTVGLLLSAMEKTVTGIGGTPIATVPSSKI